MRGCTKFRDLGSFASIFLGNIDTTTQTNLVKLGGGSGGGVCVQKSLVWFC